MFFPVTAADAQKEAKHLPTTNTKLVFVIVMVVAEMCLVVLLVFYLWRRKSKRKGIHIFNLLNKLHLHSEGMFLSLYYTGKMHERLNHRDNLLLPTRILPNNGSLSSNDEKGNTELTSFDLSTIIAATNNFSVANKLGQGGFGVVYKVKFFLFWFLLFFYSRLKNSLTMVLIVFFYFPGTISQWTRSSNQKVSKEFQARNVGTPK